MSGVNPALGTLSLLYHLMQNYNPNGETRVGPQQAMSSPNGVGVNVELGRGNFPGQEILEQYNTLPYVTMEPTSNPTPYQSVMNQGMQGSQEDIMAQLLSQFPGLMTGRRGGM